MNISTKEYDSIVKEHFKANKTIEDYKIKFTDPFFNSEEVFDNALKIFEKEYDYYLVFRSEKDILKLNSNDCDVIDFNGEQKKKFSSFLKKKIEEENERINQKQNLNLYNTIVSNKKTTKSKRKIQ